MTDDHGAVATSNGDAQPTTGDAAQCPVPHGDRAPRPAQGGGNRAFWPDRLNVKILAKEPAVINPLGEDFDYAADFNSLDLAAVKSDIAQLLTTSQSL